MLLQQRKNCVFCTRTTHTKYLPASIASIPLCVSSGSLLFSRCKLTSWKLELVCLISCLFCTSCLHTGHLITISLFLNASSVSLSLYTRFCACSVFLAVVLQVRLYACHMLVFSPARVALWMCIYIYIFIKLFDIQHHTTRATVCVFNFCVLFVLVRCLTLDLFNITWCSSPTATA